jgi:hypothetical protein
MIVKLSISLKSSFFRVFTISVNNKNPKSNVTNSFRHLSMAGECVQRMPGLNPTAVEPHSTSAPAASWQQLGSSSGAHARSHNLDAFTPGKNKIKIVRKVLKLWCFQDTASLSMESVLAYSAVSLTSRLGLDLFTTAADWRQLSFRQFHR